MKTKDFSGIKNKGSLPNPREVQMPADDSSLVTEYVESTTSMLDELEEATLAYEAGQGRTENAAVIRRILHKIKGESSMVSCDDVAELCHQAEDAFEELPEDERPDMLLRFKDWLCTALEHVSTL